MKECIFCESTITKSNKSKEHVFPIWFLKLINPEFSNFLGKHTTYPNKPEEIFFEGNQDIYSLVLGNVCTECNSGWMSKLEEDTKPILLAVLDDSSPIILTNEQCFVLSKWIFKTVITLNYAINYKKIIPIEHVHNLYKYNLLPINAKIDLAFSHDIGFHQLIGGNKIVILSNGYQDQNEFIKKIYVITLQFNHLLIRFSWTPDNNVQVKLFPIDSVYRIYPQPKNEISIQVIRGKVFRDISQFHFKFTVFTEDKIADEKYF